MVHPQQIFDKERISFNIARLKKGGETFEVILADIDKAVDIKNKVAGVDIRDAIQGNYVFRDAKKGEKAAESTMKQWLGTADHLEAAKIIIQKGEINLTAEQRNKLLEIKKKKIINYIHQNGADPKTGLPHPLTRIELAMKEAKIHVDPADKIEHQIEKIISKLRLVLPLSFEKAKIRIIIPPKYAGSAYSAIKGKYSLDKEVWRNDGSVQIELRVVAGVKSDLYSLLNKLTNGEVTIQELKSE